MTFIIDFFKGFAYFLLHPLYCLFFNSPRLYEKYISFCVYIKNSIPTKKEIKHFYLIYSYRYNSCMFYISLWIAQFTYKACKKYNKRCEDILNKF